MRENARMASPSRTVAPSRPRARRQASGPPKNSISHARIVQVALEQIDAVGLEAFSLRDVARSLGVYPATIYWHVESRNALLAEVAGCVIRDITPPREGRDWKQWMRALFFAYRRAVQAHPHVARLVGAQLVSNASLRNDFVEDVLGALLEAGATEATLCDAYNCVVAALSGFTTMELAPLPQEDAAAWSAAMQQRVRATDALACPLLARHLPLLANRAFILRWQSGDEVPLDSSFAAYVEVFLGGLAAFISGGMPGSALAVTT